MTADPPRTLAEKIDYLFTTVHPKGRGPYTNQEVHEATGISLGLLSTLRSGKATNPTKDKLERLSRFFGVTPAYFFDDAAADDTTTQLGLLAAMRDQGVAHLAMRAAGLSNESLESITSTVERIRQLEGLEGTST